MHLQQQECWSCNFVLKILCNHTMVNYFYGNMCTHNHISSNLWCPYCCELSSLLFECDHLHVDEIVFVLQLVEWIVNFIKSVCGMYELIFAYLLSSHFFIFVYMWFSYAAYFIFPVFWVLFKKILSKWCRWPIYRYIIYYCVIFCLHIFLYTCFVVSWDIFSVSAKLFLLSS